MQHDSQPDSRLKAFMCTERWRNVVNENSHKGKYTNRKKRMTNKHKKTYEDRKSNKLLYKDKEIN